MKVLPAKVFFLVKSGGLLTGTKFKTLPLNV